MKKSIRKKWVAALRSGEFEQAVGQLRVVDNNGAVRYCCLGVLCELHRREVGGEWTSDARAYLGAISELPPGVLRWAGLVESNPFMVTDNKTLAELNDEGMKFEKIADVIDSEL